ncbi:MAG: YdcF family protein, partial [Clostridiales bacterium]|nr:YdcF family protein [Clostridiales bacterium]
MRRAFSFLLRHRRPILWLAAAALIAEAALVGALVYTEKKKWPIEPADAIIVLGARVYPDGRASLMLQYRLDQALSLYMDGYADRLIVCGAKGGDEPAAEADVMAQYLIDRGVPGGAILRDDQSYSTLENLRHAQALMAGGGLSTAIVVTTDYHIQRAMWLARDIGLTAWASPARTPGIPSTYVASR